MYLFQCFSSDRFKKCCFEKVHNNSLKEKWFPKWTPKIIKRSFWKKSKAIHIPINLTLFRCCKFITQLCHFSSYQKPTNSISYLHFLVADKESLVLSTKEHMLRKKFKLWVQLYLWLLLESSCNFKMTNELGTQQLCSLIRHILIN